MAHSDDATRERLRTIVQDGDASAMPEVLAIRATGDWSTAARVPRNMPAAERALDGLGDNDAVAPAGPGRRGAALALTGSADQRSALTKRHSVGADRWSALKRSLTASGSAGRWPALKR